ncbi:granzyme F [Sigmodon hispidus]
MPPVLTLLIFLMLGACAGIKEEIIGGHEVKPNSRPYMAFIKSVNDDGEISHCGGFLVRDNYVLTAAHCMGRSMKVTLGAHNIRVREKTQQIIPVEKAIPHPAYDLKDISNDIMLLKLERKARRTEAVRPLRLPRANAQVKPGSVCRLPGWGKSSFSATKGSACLQEAVLNIQEDHVCKSHFHCFIKTIEICAGDPKNKQGALEKEGDSGGPLVCDNRAFGILSYGKNKSISLEIFTNVVNFLPWIRRNMKPN